VATACLGGEIPRRFSRVARHVARDVPASIRKLFRERTSNLEIRTMAPGRPDRSTARSCASLRAAAFELIATMTPTTSPPRREDHDALPLLLTGQVGEQRRQRLRYSGHRYIKSERRWAAVRRPSSCGGGPVAIATPLWCRQKVEAYDISCVSRCPAPDPAGQYGGDYLARLSEQGPCAASGPCRIQTGFEPLLWRAGCAFELQVMEHDGLPHLLPGCLGITSLCREARGQPVGPGRGSAAPAPWSGLTPWGIRRWNPVEARPCFSQRFLNPSEKRQSMPDIRHTTFLHRSGRSEVIEYVNGEP